MLRKCLLVFLLVVTAFAAPRAQGVARQDTAAARPVERSGTWSATSAGGLRLAGTWTGKPDSTGATVMGTWTLVDAEGRTVASGAWSAAKSPARWNGAWRAVVSGRQGEYSGTWTGRPDLAGTAGFAELFEKAVQSVVSGTWRAGRQSGAWAIRAAARAP